MKILTPIISARDIDILNPTLFNTEFFCGYTPEWWSSRFENGDNSKVLSTPINNRNGKNSNVTDITELQEIVKKCRYYETNLFLVLNAKCYPEYIYNEIAEYLDEVISAGINRMIVCDIGMIWYLKENYPEIKVSVSCLNQITNSKSVQFYLEFGNVDRIVFPRHMSSSEIENIVMKYPKVEFEYFIFSNKCLYDDGYCRGIHEFTPICKDLYYSEFYSKEGFDLRFDEEQTYREKDFEFHNWTRNELNSFQKRYCTPNFACTACSLVKLSKCTNIVSVKISIRGHGIDERIRQVKMAKNVIDAVETEKTEESIKKIVSKLYGKEDLCESGRSCMMI